MLHDSTHSALVDTRFGSRENPHPAQWAAQLVLGLRAFRRLVDVAGRTSGMHDVRVSIRSGRESRALPAHESGHAD
jgi:hypothetical protein